MHRDVSCKACSSSTLPSIGINGDQEMLFPLHQVYYKAIQSLKQLLESPSSTATLIHHHVVHRTTFPRRRRIPHQSRRHRLRVSPSPSLYQTRTLMNRGKGNDVDLDSTGEHSLRHGRIRRDQVSSLISFLRCVSLLIPVVEPLSMPARRLSTPVHSTETLRTEDSTTCVC